MEVKDMKNRRISVEVSKTINLGNYESMRFQAGVAFDVVEWESTDSAFRTAWKEAEGQLTTRIGVWNEARNK